MHKVTASIPILALGSVLLTSSINYYIFNYRIENGMVQADDIITTLWSGWSFVGTATFLAAVGVPVLAFGIILLAFGLAGRLLITLQKTDAKREQLLIFA